MLLLYYYKCHEGVEFMSNPFFFPRQTVTKISGPHRPRKGRSESIKMQEARKAAVLLLCSTLAISMVVYPLTRSSGRVELEYEFDEDEQNFSTLHPVDTRCAKR